MWIRKAVTARWVMILCLGWAWGALEQAPAEEAPLILDTTSFWRMYHVMKRPVLQDGGALRPIPQYGDHEKLVYADKMLKFWHQTLLGSDTPPPAADWFQPEFEDLDWVRAPARRACLTPYLARLCLRGKFNVTDPAQVKGLKLSLAFHGGVVVYLNGQELARQNCPQGAEVAEAYPPEAFLGADGKLINLRGLLAQMQKDKVSGDVLQRMDSRDRTLSVELPGARLQKGLNVLGIEILRAPYHKAVEEQKTTTDSDGLHQVYELSWNTCEIRRVQLTAASLGGVAPGAVRPAGIQVWNSDPMATDFDLDFGIPAEKLRPIRLVGARNGTFSGKVVVGSDQAISGLAATPGELKGSSGGSIPAAQVKIRYALPWGSVVMTNARNFEATPYPADTDPLMALEEAPRLEFPVRKKSMEIQTEITRWGWSKEIPMRLPGQPDPVFGAVVPVWVSIKVPKDAKPGTYTGTVRLEAGGKMKVEIPVELKVEDWTLSDPKDYRTWFELIQSPDTLCLEYGMPLWSEKHWEMIDKSMSYISEVGSSVLFCPLIAQSNAGNAESMVRWIKKSDGHYEYDFSILEKYLDLAEKRLGKPKVIILNAWDRYLGTGSEARGPKGSAKSGPLVTMLDPGSTQTRVEALPAYTDPASAGLWKPLYDQLRARMQKRGLEKALMLGMVSDFWASKEHVEFLKQVSGGLPWANAGHYVRKSLYDGLAQFGYQSSYFGTEFGYTRSLYGWKRPEMEANFDRAPLDLYPVVKWRLLAEPSINGNMRGVGRVGGDSWYAIKDKNGKRVARAWERWPASDWGYLNCNCSTLAPGPTGPVATMRFESLREGVEECEAIIELEQALTDESRKARLGAELVKRCEDTLAERRACIWKAFSLWQSGSDDSHEPTCWRIRASPTGTTWYLGSGWQARSQKLYSLAGEVDRKLGGSR